jgi:hypothetical protein
MKADFLNVERFGSAHVACRQRRRNPGRLHDYPPCKPQVCNGKLDDITSPEHSDRRE